MKGSSQRTNKFKDRDTYSVKRVDMSQYLPKLEFAPHRKKTIEIKSPRSKSQVVKPIKRLLLHDEISKRHQAMLVLDPKIVSGPKGYVPHSNLHKPSNSIKFDSLVGPSVLFPGNHSVLLNKDNIRLNELEYPEFRNGSIKTDFDPRSSITKNKLNLSDAKPPGAFLKLDSETVSEIRNLHTHGRKTEAYLDVQQMHDPRVVATEGENEHEEPTMTANELKEYDFLNQAKSINIFQPGSPDDYEKIDISMQVNNKENSLMEAINNLKESYENQERYGGYMSDLELILDANYKEMKISVDFSELSELFCELIMDTGFNLDKRMKILSFLYFFCEEALFGLNLNFVKIYETISDVSFKIVDIGNNILDKNPQMRRNIHRAFLGLHKGFTKEFYFLERDKLEAICEKFIHGIKLNFEYLDNNELSNEQKFFGTEKFIPFFSQFGDAYIEIFKQIIKKYEVRSHILNNEHSRKGLIEFLNGLNEFLDLGSQWPIDHLKEKNIQQFLQYILNCYDVNISIFKYSEFSELWRDQSLGLQKGIEEIIIQMLGWLTKLMNKKKFFILLFDKAHESAAATPATANGGFTSSAIANVLDSFGNFLENGKLYEDSHLNFENILLKIIELLTSLQNLINSKAFKHDFEMFAEGIVKQPFKKFAKRIIKHLDLLKGGNYFEKDPLASIIQAHQRQVSNYFCFFLCLNP